MPCLLALHGNWLAAVCNRMLAEMLQWGSAAAAVTFSLPCNCQIAFLSSPKKPCFFFFLRFSEPLAGLLMFLSPAISLLTQSARRRAEAYKAPGVLGTMSLDPPPGAPRARLNLPLPGPRPAPLLPGCMSPCPHG